ncbi:MAG: pyruvate carboxyltransferase [Abditibacteriota bacterium]|nr:pyruvate carboxyltransferase [Abditibacteriota bacterium]
MKAPFNTNMYRVSPWDFDAEVTKNFDFAKDIKFHDVTLRDGEQETGVVFLPQDKVEIARQLAKIGIDRIEAGMPAVSEQDAEACKQIAAECKTADVFAFARCMLVDVEKALSCGCKGIILEISTNRQMVEKAYNKDYEWAKQAAIDATLAAKEKGLFVSFFCIDSTRSDINDLLSIVGDVAEKGHLDSVTLADSFGCIIPEGYAAMVRKVKDTLGKPVEAHCHMQFGLGTANTLAALAAGANVAHITCCGLGEGAGNTPYEEVIMALRCMYGIPLNHLRTEYFMETAKMVCEKANNHALPVNRPVLGERVFEVESGIGVMFNANAAKHNDQELLYTFNPAMVGQKYMDFVMGKKSGSFTIDLWLERMGRLEGVTKEQKNEMLEKVKAFAFRKKNTLTVPEFEAIVDEVIGKPAVKPTPGNPILDQQVSRAGEQWLKDRKIYEIDL